MLLQIEVTSEKPLYQQIHDQVVEGIATGQLQPGKTLPSLYKFWNSMTHGIRNEVV